MMSLPDFRYKQIAVHIAGGSREKLKFRADNIIIESADGKVIFQHSCHRLFALFIIGEMSLTSVAIHRAVSFAFPIILMTGNMKVSVRINCAAEGNTLLRKKQYCEEERRLLIAKALIRQKIANQGVLLTKLRHLSKEDRLVHEYLQKIDVDKATDTASLMGMEGDASKRFFAAYFRSLKWVRREPRCKRDIYNLLLDIGYTYLFNFIESMLSIYGFDLFCGVHHTFFYQRKSLVCDIVEPFRCIIDQRLRKAYNLNQIDTDDFFIQDHHYQLKYKEQYKYIGLFMKDILSYKEDIFLFCQSYYRWFMRGEPVDRFPVFRI